LAPIKIVIQKGWLKIKKSRSFNGSEKKSLGQTGKSQSFQYQSSQTPPPVSLAILKEFHANSSVRETPKRRSGSLEEGSKLSLQETYQNLEKHTNECPPAISRTTRNNNQPMNLQLPSHVHCAFLPDQAAKDAFYKN